MPTRTSIDVEEKATRVSALMGITYGDTDFNAVVDGTFHIDEHRQKRFRDRLSVKDLVITRQFHQSDIATEEQEAIPATKELPKWLSDKIGPYYTNEYITIRRKEHITHLSGYLKEMGLAFGDKSALSMYSRLFFNEIDTIYKSFLETRQDEHFLSIVNLFEETFKRNELSKKVLREAMSVLKSIRDLDNIDYRDYEQAVARFFSIGADIISIKETIDEE